MLLLLLGSACVSSHAQQSPHTPESFYTAFVSCWNEDSKDYRSRSVQSPVFTSPDGRTRAYVRVTATAKEKNAEGTEQCLNESTLFVATGAEYGVAYRELGVTQGPQGNAIQIVDWSPDSKYLLLDLLTWWYESECCNHVLLLYSPSQSKMRRVNMNRVLAPQGCTFDGWIEGFAENADVVFTAHSSEPIGNPCVTETSRWRLDVASLRVKRLRPTYKLHHYARTERPIPAEPWKERARD